MSSRRSAVTAAALLACCALTACGGSSGHGSRPAVLDPTGPALAATSSPTPLPVLKPGASATVQVGDGTVKVTVRSLTSRKKCGGEDPTPPENGLYVIADVVLEVTAGRADVDGGQFEWVADDGTTADFSVGTGCLKNALGDGRDLTTGQKRAGQLVYDVANAKGALEYTADPAAGPVESWKQ